MDTPNNGEELQAIRDDRYKHGQCPNCGTQLFKIKKKGLLNKTEVRKPLNTPGLVERGQCLKCLSNKTATEDGGHLLAAAAISSVGEVGRDDDTSNNNLDGSQPRAAQQQPNNATAGETVYIGDFNQQGERHGPGELLWSNGDKYVGNFENGLRSGQGTLHFKDGTCVPCLLVYGRCFGVWSMVYGVCFIVKKSRAIYIYILCVCVCIGSVHSPANLYHHSHPAYSSNHVLYCNDVL